MWTMCSIGASPTCLALALSAERSLQGLLWLFSGSRVIAARWDDIFFCGLRSSETHPLNLSISISGGRETNRDSLSNGERSGNMPRSEISRLAIVTAGRIVVWRGGLSRSTACEPEVDLERHAKEGESPVGPGNRKQRDEGPYS